MSETLLRPSLIKLYGRALKGLTVDPKEIPSSIGGNKFLQQQLAQKDARLARIYGFSYEGHYYHLGQPVILLVHGDGDHAVDSTIEDSGVGARDWAFATDMRVWDYDKGDFSLRIDTESGPLQDILLEAELANDEMQTHYAGRKVQAHYSGRKVQAHYSGRKVRGPGGD